MSTFSYSAYGLGINSALRLPELPSGEQNPDIFIQLDAVAQSVPTSPCGSGWVRSKPNEIAFCWPRVGKFIVRRDAIIVRPAPHAEEKLLRLFIMGSALALVLHLRKKLVLHAGTVAVDGAAVVIMGQSGGGKSSLCSALYARGHEAVSDDVTGLDYSERAGWIAIPAFPQFKVWPDAVRALGFASNNLPRIRRKLAIDSTKRFHEKPLSLRRIYVLATGPSLAVGAMSLKESLMEVVRHSYCFQVLETVELARHFVDCGTLVKEVPLRRLRRTNALSTLCDLARLVEKDLDQA
jgi:hypothetical protein